MDIYLIAAAKQGVVVCEQDSGQWRQVRKGLDGYHLTSVIAREGVILAGAREGIFKSEDMGRSWSPANNGLSVSHVRWLAFHPDISNFEFAGTEPAAIFVSKDGGQKWTSCEEVEALREQFGWRLPYSPEAGCVRGFAFLGSRAYAAVEDGGVLVSDQGGERWRLAKGSSGRPDHNPRPGFVHSDVHSIAVHPSSADLVFAPTGGGFYRSRDGGETWETPYAGCYVRAVWVDASDPEHMILGPADGVDRNGRIEETEDGGRTWRDASDGLATPWRGSMVERFSQTGDQLIAVLSNGELFAASLDTLEWQPVLDELSGVAAVTAMES